MTERPNIWLSVDFDYFCREEEKWEFGHGEHALYLSLAWQIRTAQFLTHGSSLRQDMSLRYARPYPRAFWRSLNKLGYRFNKVKHVIVADSHRWGYLILNEKWLGKADGTRLVHFDAHHDLVYNVSAFKHAMETNVPGCDNWHLMTLLHHPELQSLIVYPPWKGLRDWENTVLTYEKVNATYASDVISMLRSKTEPCVWGDPKVAQAAGDVEAIFICRSGGWVPPWHDVAFRQFCLDSVEFTGLNLTCPFIKEERVDPLERRSFDWNSVYRTAALERAIIEPALQHLRTRFDKVKGSKQGLLIPEKFMWEAKKILAHEAPSP